MSTIKRAFPLFVVVGVLVGLMATSCKGPIIDGAGSSSGAEITVFSLGITDEVDAISSQDATVNVKVPYGSQLSSLKPATIAISPGASVEPGKIAFRSFEAPVTYTVTAEDGITTKVWTVTVTFLPNTAREITRFSFGLSGESDDINQTNHTVTVSVPHGTDVSTLAPTVISVSPQATVSPGTGVAKNFASAQTYTVTAGSGATQEYVVSVVPRASNQAEFSKFDFAGIDGETVTISNTTITVEVPYGTSLNLKPSNSVVLGASVSPLMTDSQDFSGPVQYTVTADDGTQVIYTVNVTVLPNTEARITAFGFGVAGEVDTISDTTATTGTIEVTVPYGTPLTSRAPITLIVSAQATVSPGIGVAQNFTSVQNYTVTAGDTVTKRTYTVTVKVAKNTAADITGFSLVTGDSLSIDMAAHKVYVTVPLTTTTSALTSRVPANLAVSAQATVSPSASAALNFTQTQTYTVTSEDGKNQVAWTVIVTNPFSLSYASSLGTVPTATRASTVTLGANPTASGYLFGGWYSSDASATKAYTAGDTITLTQDTTLTATWFATSDGTNITAGSLTPSGAPYCIIPSGAIVPNSVFGSPNTTLKGIHLSANVSFANIQPFMGVTAVERITSNSAAYLAENNWLFDSTKSTVYFVAPKGVSGAITLPSTVTAIKAYAFDSCTEITSIAWSSTLTTIPGNALSGLKGSVTLTVPTTVTAIADYAFYNAYGLSAITFTPTSTLTTIGASAFGYCTSLTTLTLPATVSTIGASAFIGCTAFTSLKLSGPYTTWTSVGTTLFSGVPTSYKIYVPSAYAPGYSLSTTWITYAANIVSY